MAPLASASDRTLKKKLLISAISLVLTVLLLEITLRVFFSPYITSIYELDERCLFRPKPDTARYWQRVPPNERPLPMVSINSKGYRGSERAFVEGEYRVLVFGDSFVMAEFSPESETYTQQLERELASVLDRPVHVINAGTAGGGPDQYVPRLANEIPLVVPDLVVVAIYAGNDFGDLVRNKMFSVDEHGTLLRTPFTISDKLQREFGIADAPAIYRLVRRLRTDMRMQRGFESMDVDDPAERLAISHRMLEQDLGLSRNEYEEYVVNQRFDVRVLLEDHYDADLAAEPDSASARFKVRLMEAVFAELARVVRHHNVPLLCLAIPSPADVIPDYAGGSVDRAKYPAYVPSRLTDHVARIAEHNAVKCVDLYEPFVLRGAEVYLLAPDIHWNGAGQAIAARLTREAIVAAGFAQPK